MCVPNNYILGVLVLGMTVGRISIMNMSIAKKHAQISWVVTTRLHQHCSRSLHHTSASRYRCVSAYSFMKTHNANARGRHKLVECSMCAKDMRLHTAFWALPRAHFPLPPCLPHLQLPVPWGLFHSRALDRHPPDASSFPSDPLWKNSCSSHAA